MVKHFNFELPQQISDIFKIKGEELPQNISDEIKLVYDIRPQITDIQTGVLTNNTVTDIFTTPTNVDYFILGATLSVVKDATATSTQSSISATVLGSARTILTIAGLTLTPQNQTVTITFPTPIKCERGTPIRLNHSTAVANCTSRCTIYGYRVE